MFYVAQCRDTVYVPYDRNKTVPRAATGFRPRLLDALWE